MSKFSKANIKKTFYYMKKNGFYDTTIAAIERLKTKEEGYNYFPPTKQELQEQSQISFKHPIKISIVVPLYNTPINYLKEMIESVCKQSYGEFELLLSDASTEEYLRENNIEEIVNRYEDNRIVYIKLEENKGISDNTNIAIRQASGDYIGLLDHDDCLTLDALYEVTKVINRYIDEKGKAPYLIYSSEDKADGEMKSFYDVNIKPKFDQDYLWSNNYICHFTVIKGEILKKLELRSEFDGAQDYDVILRAAYESEKDFLQVLNIEKVLYHWRCHNDSTAINPQSKLYAYEAGKRAVEVDLERRNIKAIVKHSKHLGFYHIEYENIMKDRLEVGMVVPPKYKKLKIVSGARSENGRLLYDGLYKGFSGGHLHRASTWQQIEVGDILNSYIRKGLLEEFIKAKEVKGEAINLSSIETIITFAEFLHSRGYKILYNPQ